MLLLILSLIFVATHAQPESVEDMYVAKLRRYRPNRRFSDDARLGEEVENLIRYYNTRVPHGTLSKENDGYRLSVFGILCAISINNMDHDDWKQCREIHDNSRARDFLTRLLKESST